MNNSVQLVECPRDAWQALPGHIPAEAKAAYLRALINAGFAHIDAASFVSPRAVPQMADSEEVLALLNPLSNVEIIGIIVNSKGAERAIQTSKVTTLGFPYSISPTFLERNQHQSQADALKELSSIAEAAHSNGLNTVGYLSMAFGNPYGDAWSADEVIAGCEAIAQAGVHTISLADTVGLAAPEQIAEVFAKVRTAMAGDIALGLHLHARPDSAAAKLRAAYLAGCRRFDTALGGFGGCPFAQDALVGNVATETARAELTQLGAVLPPLANIDKLLDQTRNLNSEYGRVHAQT
ncbi:MAG: hydroxymethylglutaryl-CoA lyase [Acidobacteriota bacterium]|nr:hydroxymethylglutaryl-CoA lyase [Acidobacteriota bacterium]